MLKTVWKDVVISAAPIDAVLAEVEKHKGDNPACALIGYWAERMSPPMLQEIRDLQRLPYGFVGSGWPYPQDQTATVEKYDREGFARFYAQEDLHTRDAGDAIYQANRIRSLFAEAEDPTTPQTWVDFGAGYGRLAYPLVRAYPKTVLRYLGVDYSPVGLVVAPQFIDQTCPPDHGFESWPAWKLGEVPEQSVDVFVSIHSFQEMSPETCRWYVEFMRSRARANHTLFYSVNLNPPDYIPAAWPLVSERAFPVNRDGSYFERVWGVVP